MAVAKQETIVVEKWVKTDVQETVVQLSLNKDEAQFLYDLMQKVGGCESTSRRKHAEAIDQALKGMKGVVDSDYYRKPGDFSPNYANTIYFLPESI